MTPPANGSPRRRAADMGGTQAAVLEGRIDVLEERISSVDGKVDDLKGTVAGLNGKVDGIKTDLAVLQTERHADNLWLREKIEGIDKRFDTFNSASPRKEGLAKWREKAVDGLITAVCGAFVLAILVFLYTNLMTPQAAKTAKAIVEHAP